MSTAPGIAVAERLAEQQLSPLEQYRDDGPLARLLGALGGPLVPTAPLVHVLAGLAGLAAAVALTGDGASEATVAAAVAWLVAWGGISSGRPHRDRFAWALPAMLRLGEYGALIWIGSVVGGAGPAGAFAVVAALAFRHYDLVYRSRFQGKPPAAWLALATGGWDGRLVVVALLLVAGALPAGLFAIAAILAVACVSDAVVSWARHSASPVSIYEDEEDEGD